jgi:ribosomal protein S18 acetylase RimI-like enzyme
MVVDPRGLLVLHGSRFVSGTGVQVVDAVPIGGSCSLRWRDMDANCANLALPYPIRRLERLSAAEVGQLADVLIDCVEGGASIGFMLPISRERAIGFWTGVGEAVARGERVLLVAQDERGICGTVQLVLDLPDNQPHRADLVKTQVHSRARRCGLGEALMREAERHATLVGRTLLVLDAVTGGDAARLYERLGWVRVGDVPGFALYPDGRPCGTTYYYKNLGG